MDISSIFTLTVSVVCIVPTWLFGILPSSSISITSLSCYCLLNISIYITPPCYLAAKLLCSFILYDIILLLLLLLFCFRCCSLLTTPYVKFKSKPQLDSINTHIERRCPLYKLLLYEKGGFLKSHRECERKQTRCSSWCSYRKVYKLYKPSCSSVRRTHLLSEPQFTSGSDWGVLS